MKIKQAAEKLQVSTRTIRFYEEKGLISPVKEDNQYRVFSNDDLERLRTIIAFREIDMPLTQIKEMLQAIDHEKHEKVSAFLEVQRSEVTAQWLKMKQMVETIDDMITSQKGTNKVGLKEMHDLATGLNKINELRSDWKDRWNFDRQAAHYDQQVYKRDTRFDVHANYDEALELTVESIDAQQDEIGLDIGIGTGNLAARILQENHGTVMHGTDQSMEMLKQCNQKLPHVETKLGNFLALPYENDRFDFVVTSYALHHLSDDQKLLALEEMTRVLKKSGRICIADLMFVNDEDRDAYFGRLKEAGNFSAVSAIQDEYYADRSRLVAWLSENGYHVKKQKLNDYLHVVFAAETL